MAALIRVYDHRKSIETHNEQLEDTCRVWMQRRRGLHSQCGCFPVSERLPGAELDAREESMVRVYINVECSDAESKEHIVKVNSIELEVLKQHASPDQMLFSSSKLAHSSPDSGYCHSPVSSTTKLDHDDQEAWKTPVLNPFPSLPFSPYQAASYKVLLRHAHMLAALRNSSNLSENLLSSRLPLHLPIYLNPTPLIQEQMNSENINTTNNNLADLWKQRIASTLQFVNNKISYNNNSHIKDKPSLNETSHDMNSSLNDYLSQHYNKQKLITEKNMQENFTLNNIRNTMRPPLLQHDVPSENPKKRKFSPGNVVSHKKKKMHKDDLKTSPVSGTYIRDENDDSITPVCRGDIDTSFNFVEVTPEAKAELEKIENKIGDYVCCLCKEKYDDAFQLAQHRCSRIVHVEYKCSECDKVFNCPANLASHKRWHRPNEDNQKGVLLKKQKDQSPPSKSFFSSNMSTDYLVNGQVSLQPIVNQQLFSILNNSQFANRFSMPTPFQEVPLNLCISKRSS